MAFDPKSLVPAAHVEAFSKATGQRSMKQVALDNIERTKALFLDSKKEGKRNFKAVGDRVAFTIRVNNTALMLEVADVNGTKVDVREMTAPTKAFVDALDYYAERIRKDEFKAQLDALAGKREQRTSKMRQTRAAKKTEGAKP